MKSREKEITRICGIATGKLHQIVFFCGGDGEVYSTQHTSELVSQKINNAAAREVKENAASLSK